MAELARNRGISVDHGTAEELPLTTDDVDLAALLGVVGYVDDLEEVFAQLARVVSPGGHAVVAFLRANGAFAELYDTAADRGAYPATLDWETPYPLEMARKATWRDVETVLSGLRSVGFTDITTVQTLTQPIEAASQLPRARWPVACQWIHRVIPEGVFGRSRVGIPDFGAG